MKLIPIFSLGMGLASANTQCGQAALNPFIVGGQEATPGAYPWQVSLRGCRSCRHFCGGSIISDEWIVTAAHCVSANEDYWIAVGEHELYSDGTKLIKTSETIPHERYNRPTQINNDIALLRLSEKLTFTDQIQPICVHNSDTMALNDDGDNVMVTGWGTLSEGGSISDTLQEITVPLVSNAECNDPYGGDITQQMMCAGLPEGGKDACQGDSGGPLVFKHTTGQWTLAGVVSWGYGCAREGIPGVYARVGEFTDWIADNSGVISDIGDTSSPATPTGTTPTVTTPTNEEDLLPTDGDACNGGIRLVTPGTFSSNGFPNNAYGNDLDCAWQLQGDSDAEKLILSFSDQFNIEPAKIDCHYDRIIVNDVEYCGAKAPNDIEIEGSLTTVRFQTDHNVTRSGFEVSWDYVSLPTTDPPVADSPTLSESSSSVVSVSDPTIDPTYTQEIIDGTFGQITCDRTIPSDDRCYIRVAVEKDHGIEITSSETSHREGCIEIYGLAGNLQNTRPELICNSAIENALLARFPESDTITIDSKDFLGSFVWNFKAIEEGESITADSEDAEQVSEDPKCGNPAYTPNIDIQANSGVVNFADHKINRVVGGTIAIPHSYPWQVSLRLGGGSFHYCGGSIIDEYHILTAAHCDFSVTGGELVIAGDHVYGQSIPQVEEGIQYSGESVHTHPQYGSSQGAPSYDFQIIKLAEKIKFNDKVQPICLPEETEQFEENDCILTGWGFTDGWEQTDPQFLMQAKLPTMTNTECDRRWGGIDESMICAGNGISSACNGDSGGPLVCKNSAGFYQLAGVVSWGQQGCTPNNLPSVFGRVTSVLDWIEDVRAGNFQGRALNGKNTSRNLSPFEAVKGQPVYREIE